MSHTVIFAQKDTATIETKEIDVSGTISVTDEGISTVPAISLGKPATIVQMSIGNKLTFEPDLRFSLNAKPWQFIFWLKYKLIEAEDFQLKLGVNPSYNFFDIDNPEDTRDKTSTVIQKNTTFDLDVLYSYNDHLDFEFYYMYVYGFDAPVSGLPTNIHYVNISSVFKELNLYSDFYLMVKPQLYFLQIDHDHGFYAATDINISKKRFPFSISSTFNKHIATEITGNPDPNWNISLVYSFSF